MNTVRRMPIPKEPPPKVYAVSEDRRELEPLTEGVEISGNSSHGRVLMTRDAFAKAWPRDIFIQWEEPWDDPVPAYIGKIHTARSPIVTKWQFSRLGISFETSSIRLEVTSHLTIEWVCAGRMPFEHGTVDEDEDEDVTPPKLKPCPFCGGEKIDYIRPADGALKWEVKGHLLCLTCGTEGPKPIRLESPRFLSREKIVEDLDSAISHWNTRSYE